MFINPLDFFFPSGNRPQSYHPHLTDKNQVSGGSLSTKRFAPVPVLRVRRHRDNSDRLGDSPKTKHSLCPLYQDLK